MRQGPLLDLIIDGRTLSAARDEVREVLWAAHVDSNRLLDAFSCAPAVVSVAELRTMLLCLGFDREQVKSEGRGTVLMSYVNGWGLITQSRPEASTHG